MQPTAKDLVVAKIKNLELPINEGFYDKARGDMTLEVTKFDGVVKEQLGDLENSSISLLVKEDVPNNIIKMQLNTIIKEKKNSSDLYLVDNKMIMTKDILYLLKELGINDVETDTNFIKNAPKYLYITDQSFKNIWDQLKVYQQQQIPDEYKKLLIFMVETIPDKYFSISSGKVVLELDQQGIEEVIYNLVNKAKNEKERFADIILGLNTYSTMQAEISEDEMRQQVINGLEQATMPTKEEIHQISNFVTMDLLYEASILPGGANNYEFNIDVESPEVTGTLALTGNYAGKEDNLKGTYNITGNFDVASAKLNFEADCDFSYAGKVANSNTIASIYGKDTSSDQWFDIGFKSSSSSEVDKNLTIKKPTLTADNSMDMSELINQTQLSPAPTPQDSLSLVVNGELVKTDILPVIKQGRTYVPVRFVSEALDCDVQWNEPNEVKISSNDKAISMYINKFTYTGNGLQKKMDAAPYKNGGRTMVPVRFIAQELGAKVQMIGNTVVISK